MTASDLRTLIRTETMADEPPFLMSSLPSTVAGRRVVRWRRTLSAAAGAALATLVVAIGGAVLPGGGPTTAVFPPAVQEALAEYDPDTFPATLDAEVRELLPGVVPESVEPRIEPTTFDGWARLHPKDYDYADSWTAWYDLSPTDQLMVVLRHDQSANEGNARAYCEQNLRAGDMERCEASTLEDGSVAIVSVSTGGPTVERSSHAAGGEEPWFVRQVVNRRDYGFGVIAREYVKAPSLEAADRLWSVDVDGLSRIASSPRLVYELPPPPEEDCILTLPPEKEFARVVCRQAETR